APRSAAAQPQSAGPHAGHGAGDDAHDAVPQGGRQEPQGRHRDAAALGLLLLGPRLHRLHARERALEAASGRRLLLDLPPEAHRAVSCSCRRVGVLLLHFKKSLATAAATHTAAAAS
ncbi:MAG: hypothetical protein CMP54_03890, partial [Flavobacteriales bacterium]|nr:hypothetical protein [Flavobacteriales bacterium]